MIHGIQGNKRAREAGEGERHRHGGAGVTSSWSRGCLEPAGRRRSSWCLRGAALTVATANRVAYLRLRALGAPPDLQPGRGCGSRAHLASAQSPGQAS